MLFSVIVWIIIGLFTVLLGIAVCILGIFDRSGNLPHLCGRVWGKFICRVSMVDAEIAGLENIYPDRAQIFVSNHQSFFDIFVLLAYIPVQFRWVAKESLFRIPFVGWGMRACRHIGVNRTNKKEAMRSFIEASRRLKDGKSIVIFPEGTRTVEGHIGDFKKGSLLLAIRNRLPVVPVTIQGSSDVMKKGSMKITPGKIRVVLDKPIDTGYFVRKKEESLRIHIRKILTKNLEGS